MNLKIIVISLTAGIVLFPGYMWGQNTLKLSPEPVFCTQEAKQCPDGSYVGRTGPKCEFNPCPVVAAGDFTGWQTYRNEKYWFEMKYPSDWKYSENNNSDENTFFICLNSVADPSCSGGGGMIFVSSNTTLDAQYKSIQPRFAEPYEYKKSEILVSGHKAYEFVSDNPEATSKAIFIERNPHIYSLILNWHLVRVSNKDILNQILSTFKFIENSTENKTADLTVSCALGTFVSFDEPPVGSKSVVIYKSDYQDGPWMQLKKSALDKSLFRASSSRYVISINGIDGRGLYFKIDALTESGQITQIFYTNYIPIGTSTGSCEI